MKILSLISIVAITLNISGCVSNSATPSANAEAIRSQQLILQGLSGLDQQWQKANNPVPLNNGMTTTNCHFVGNNMNCTSF